MTAALASNWPRPASACRRSLPLPLLLILGLLCMACGSLRDALAVFGGLRLSLTRSVRALDIRGA